MTGMAGAPADPSGAAFVIDTDATGLDVRQRSAYDLWVAASNALVPLVILVHGPVRSGPRPRDWPVYRGYASLLARAGLAAAVSDLDYADVEALSGPIAQLDEVTEAARAEAGVDGARGGIWAFSGGARLVGRWIEEPPDWLRGVGLTYPVVAPVRRAQVPIVLTRVGLEHPAVQETVNRLVALATDTQIIDVANGQHGFDILDHND
jgi:dienelactone hydrolase